MADEEYFKKTCEKFESIIGPWFSEEDHLITTRKFEIITAKLQELTKLRTNAKLEFDENNINMLSKIVQHGTRLNLGYEGYDQEERMIMEYFDFKPEYLISFFDPKKPTSNFVALRARGVKLVDFCEEQDGQKLSSTRLGEGIILIYPKGSQYHFDKPGKDHLLDILRNYREDYF